MITKFSSPILVDCLLKKGDKSAHFDLIESVEKGSLFFPLNSELPESEIKAYKSALNCFLSAYKSLPKELIEHGGLALLTSGSTSKPKIALFSWNRLLKLARLQAQALGIMGSSVCLLSLPLYHIAGVMMRLRAFVADAKTTFDEANATHISWVPTHLVRYLKTPYPLPKLSSLLVGGAPISSKLKKKAQSCGLPLFESYGLTEAGALICLDGKRVSGTEVRALNGEIELKGENLFLGYLDRQGQFFEHDKASWFKTGDLGEFDSCGHLKILGRSDNLFISGGENIQPEEIEEVLMQHPKIDLVCVIPTSDSEFGYRPIAYICGEERINLTALNRFLEGKLAKFKWPIKIYSWPKHIAKNKLARLQLKQEALKEL